MLDKEQHFVVLETAGSVRDGHGNPELLHFAVAKVSSEIFLGLIHETSQVILAVSRQWILLGPVRRFEASEPVRRDCESLKCCC